MAGIPEEVIEEILSRLPVKSLLRFKTVSKNWYSLISQNHTFHLKQSSSSSASKNLIFFQMPEDGTIFQSSDLDTLQSRKIKFSMSNCRIIGSANGLICLAKKNQSQSSIGDYSCFLWNPSTSQHKCISIPVLDTDQCTLYGFGYDSVSDDYKIIGDWVSHIRLFSLRTSSWKILEYSFIYPWRSPAFYSNGALHWCVGPHITAFDLANETIFDLELPDEISRYTWVPVFGYQGYLCVCGHRSVWMMKEYGNISSWTKLGTSLSGDYDFAVGISIFGEVVFCTHDELLYVQSGRLCSDYKPQRIHFGDAFVYKESLISPKCFDPERR